MHNCSLSLLRVICVALLLVGWPLAASAEASVGSQWTEETLTVALMRGDDAERSAAADYVISQPDSVEPTGLLLVSQVLWKRGDRLQAAFWFYIWQERSRPGAMLDPSSAGALRASINATYGLTINEWIGSDITAMIDVGGRAISYEARIPLYPERPDGISAKRWNAMVVEERRKYVAGFQEARKMFGDPELNAKLRGENGLYVGPLKEPGAPLPDDWR